MPSPDAFAAVILAGGQGRRLGGVDKATLGPEGDTLLDRAAAACAAADELVVVGPDRVGLHCVREEPPGAGPAAALAAGIAALTSASPTVVVLAVDMPAFGTSTVQRLLAPLADRTDVDGTVLTGPDGHRQLALAMRRSAADTLTGRDLTDVGVWRSLAHLALVEVASVGAEHQDVDTPADLARWLDPDTSGGPVG